MTGTNTNKVFSRYETSWAPLLEQVGMGAGAPQVKEFLIGPVNQEPVGSNMALPVMFPITGKGMVSIPDGQDLSKL
jgi:hypothetical protein